MKTKIFVTVVFVAVCIVSCSNPKQIDKNNIPLPEHPRPDFMRADWVNLNGEWNFKFDKKDVGLNDGWFQSHIDFDRKIIVPFSWGSPLSGIEDEADIGWYSREIEIPMDWEGKRIYVVLGACDWKTTAWLDGNRLGEHRGGYIPFEFLLSDYVKPGGKYRLVLRVDDTPHDFKLEGKQGYGRAAGIWQTAYLEARSVTAFKFIHFTPDIDNSSVSVEAQLDSPAPEGSKIEIKIFDPQFKKNIVREISKGKENINFKINIRKMHLWTLKDPYLYQTQIKLLLPDNSADEVSTYFGMRKIGVEKLPGTNYYYVSLNNKPIYLQLTLDQSYHPGGYYTFPSDEFMKNEILRSKNIGLNGNRIHIKVEIPRKLYWADRLGLLIMADVPNFWGAPTNEAKSEWETALRGMIERDYNHPAIFSWVNFNETWGLVDGDGKYSKETRSWVESMYLLTKTLDATRLVEDNSTNNLDHVITDIDSWHAYIPGYKWDSLLDFYTSASFPNSNFNFVSGKVQGTQPFINSECGNVWGYEKAGKGFTTGDVDWSWDYHQMINAFRKHPEVAGWLYTELHDVINEWNGYYRYDRSKKETGLEHLMPGMCLNDLHSDIYISVGDNLCSKVTPGSEISVPLYASFMTDEDYGKYLVISASFFGWNAIGEKLVYPDTESRIKFKPWLNKKIGELGLTMPGETAVMVFGVRAETKDGFVLGTNFTTYSVESEDYVNNSVIKESDGVKRVVRIDPAGFSKADWSQKTWSIFNGLKVNGAGSGYFEYDVILPDGLEASEVVKAELIAELSAKRLNGKDIEGAKGISGDFMHGKGTHDPSRSPNSYPMTDEVKFPSKVKITFDGISAGVFDLEDDPADHRGILSWFNQIRDEKTPRNPKSFEDFKGGELHEAGSYGYLISTKIPKSELESILKKKAFTLRFSVDKSLPGGLAIYGRKFGRFPFDPTIIFTLRSR